MAVGEWDQRQLCPDGGCIGVIGRDGTCKVCGRAAANWGDERNRGLIPPDEPDDEDDEDSDDEDADLAADGDGRYDDDVDDDVDDDEDDDDLDDEDAEDEEAAEDDEAAAASQRRVAGARGEWSVRELCPDGGCIGVIGPDGRCKVCGRTETELPARRGDAPDTAAEASDAAAVTTEVTGASTASAAGSTAAAADREHCPDASCAGSIGANGRCEVCGQGAS